MYVFFLKIYLFVDFFTQVKEFLILLNEFIFSTKSEIFYLWFYKTFLPILFAQIGQFVVQLVFLSILLMCQYPSSLTTFSSVRSDFCQSSQNAKIYSYTFLDAELIYKVHHPFSSSVCPTVPLPFTLFVACTATRDVFLGAKRPLQNTQSVRPT